MSLFDPVLPGGSARTRLCVWLALSVAWVSAVPASAQGWNFRPVFIVGAGYDSNVVFTPGDVAPGDYFGVLGVRAPLARQLSQHTSLSASYNATCEWFQDLDGLDACPSRQTASLGWSYAWGENTSLNLVAGFAESRRPEEVFPEAGIAYLRGKTTNLGGGVSLSHRLGENTTFGLGYTHGRPIWEPAAGLGRRADSHFANASLSRNLWRQGRASLRYSYQLYLYDEFPDDSTHILGLGVTQGLWRTATLSVFVEARHVDGETRVGIRPQGNITLSHSWRRSQIRLSAGRSRNYVVTTAGFTETDSIGVSYSITLRRFRFGVSGGYARNRLEDDPQGLGRSFETYRGTVDTVYMLAHWLGAGATYQYSWQRPLTERFDPQRRHLAQVGLVISPWNDREPTGLR